MQRGLSYRAEPLVNGLNAETVEKLGLERLHILEDMSHAANRRVLTPLVFFHGNPLGGECAYDPRTLTSGEKFSRCTYCGPIPTSCQRRGGPHGNPHPVSFVRSS